MKATAAAAGALAAAGRRFAAGQHRAKAVRCGCRCPTIPASVDPMTGRNLPDFNVLYAVFDALIDFEPSTLALKPGLAKTWTFSDPKTLVLELIDGVTFHDGTPFNAEAVKFNLDRYKTDPRSNVKPDLGTVDKVEVTGAESGHPAPEQTERRPAGHLDQPGRLHGVAQIGAGERAERRPHAGRNRAVPVRRLAGQRKLHARAQRQVLEAGPALSRRHQHPHHQRAQHGAAHGDRWRGRSGPQHAGTAEGDSGSLDQRDGECRAVADLLRHLPELRPSAARRRARTTGAQLRNQSRRDQPGDRARARPAVLRDSAQDSIGPATRRPSTTMGTIPTRRSGCSPRPGTPTASSSMCTVGRIRPPCSVRN